MKSLIARASAHKNWTLALVLVVVVAVAYGASRGGSSRHAAPAVQVSSPSADPQPPAASSPSPLSDSDAKACSDAQTEIDEVTAAVEAVRDGTRTPAAAAPVLTTYAKSLSYAASRMRTPRIRVLIIDLPPLAIALRNAITVSGGDLDRYGPALQNFQSTAGTVSILCEGI